MRDSSSRSSIVPDARCASSTILSARRRLTSTSSLSASASARIAKRTDGRLQLVTDVGHEVRTNRVESSAVAEVVDDCQRTAVHQRDATDQQHPLRRPEQHQSLLAGLTGDGSCQKALDSLLHQHVDVAADRCDVIAQQLSALLVGQHDAGRHRVQPGAQALDLRLRRPTR